ncbi:MAG TPA: HepT-like ribonuclease domain-containing protein [Quisquiliibacterium sp.]|nr:HepT-like ribonuclease domain-containing protein [Quisquiliibacterium sp.]
MSEGAAREWRFYVDDMISFAEKVLSYTAGMERNRLIHGYLGLDNDTLWSIVVSDVPALLQALRALR